jgi:HlyD family secretion protein
MKYHYLITLIISILALQACSRQANISGGHTVPVKKSMSHNTLFYAGTIQPLKTLVVTSPADATVVEMPVQYGEEVKPGQLLFMLSSSKFVTDYKAALTAYVKAKSQFNSGQTQLKEAEFLHKNELISDDDYKSKQSTYYGAQLEMVQAKDNLETFIQQLGVKDMNLANLSIANIDKVTQAMHLKMSSENLRIVSPAQGVVLGTSKNEEESKKVIKGDTVKQGDVLAVIGDMSGLSVRIKVNELTINQLKVGQKVKISGIAFPNDMLSGAIQRVDRQGETANGGLPTFTVEVMTKGLSQKQKRDIHVGMSAKVEIDVDGSAELMVPIAAVSEYNGISSVRIYDDKSGKTKQVNVETGKTTMDSVAIVSGLNVGDNIIVPD